MEGLKGGEGGVVLDDVILVWYYLREVGSLYTFSGGGGDVDECAINNGGCAHMCNNTEGSFVCSCRTGFTLASDGRGCNGEQAYCRLHLREGGNEEGEGGSIC